MARKHSIRARILALLPHEPLKKKRPLTTDDLQRLLPNVRIDQLRQSLSRMKALGKVLWTGGDVKTGTGYAKKLGEKAGYYLPKKPRPEKPKPRSCKHCKKELTDRCNICQNCNRLISHMTYARNRYRQGGAIALQMEILIRQTVLELSEDTLGRMVSTAAERLRSANIDINSIPRWGGLHRGTPGEIKTKQEKPFRILTRKPRVTDEDPLYCIYCKDEIKNWIWRDGTQRWPNACHRCQRIVHIATYARNRLYRDGPIGLQLEIITRRIVMDEPEKTVQGHFQMALKELRLQGIDMDKTTVHRPR